jgi:uncharacterized protein (TIGR02145 family)
MKKRPRLDLMSLTLILIGIIIFPLSCKKDELSPEIEKGAVTDVDGNVYDAVTLGSQKWITTNLKVTKYQNGDPILSGLSNTEWENTVSGAYATYNNSDANNTTYGKLYNWYSVSDSRKLCPAGWHVPTDGEWMTLINYLGGENVAGGKLKETGTSHWNSPNEATNESSFSALPGGQRNWYGTYATIGDYGYWWTSSVGFAGGSWGISTVNSEAKVVKLNYTVECGFSVRCVKD